MSAEKKSKHFSSTERPDRHTNINETNEWINKRVAKLRIKKKMIASDTIWFVYKLLLFEYISVVKKIDSEVKWHCVRFHDVVNPSDTHIIANYYLLLLTDVLTCLQLSFFVSMFSFIIFLFRGAVRPNKILRWCRNKNSCVVFFSNMNHNCILVLLTFLMS